VEKGTDFEIMEQWVIRLAVEVTDERIIDLTLYDILHMPGLHSNLILIPKIYGLGLAMTFSKNNVMASFSDRRMAIYGVQYKGLYHVNQW